MHTHTHTHTHNTHTHTHCIHTHTTSAHTIFSLANIRHVGPTCLQYRVSFDMRVEIINVLCCGHRLHPNYVNLSCLEFSLGRTPTHTHAYMHTHIMHNLYLSNEHDQLRI